MNLSTLLTVEDVKLTELRIDDVFSVLVTKKEYSFIILNWLLEKVEYKLDNVFIVFI